MIDGFAVSLAVLASASLPVSGDAFGNRVEPLSDLAEDGQSACVGAKAWCATILPLGGDGDGGGEGAASLQVSEAVEARQDGAGSVALPALPDPGGFGGHSRRVWPMRVVLGDKAGVLAGVLAEERTMYSGGGAHQVQLTLYRFAPGMPAREILSVPWEAGAMIRACFSEKDFRQRAGACHDEYAFAATLAVVPGGAGGAPVLRYATRATSYPGPVSRSADSLSGKRLRRRDLVTVANAECSFARDFRLDPTSGTWLPDQPLPDCEDFTGL